MTKILKPLLAGAILIAAIASANAQQYPNRPIHVISPYPAGSASDTVTRVVMEQVSQLIGQPVVIDLKPGAGGAVGFGTVARSDPDGYTMATSSSSMATESVLHSKLPYDPNKDFVHVVLLGTSPNILVASVKSGFKTVADLVNAAKAKPGTLTFASAGIGSSSHMAAERFRLAANIDVVFLVHALGKPPNQRRLERELVLAFDSGARPVVVLTKADLVDDPAPTRDQLADVALGVPVLLASGRDRTGRRRRLRRDGGRADRGRVLQQRRPLAGGGRGRGAGAAARGPRAAVDLRARRPRVERADVGRDVHLHRVDDRRRRRERAAGQSSRFKACSDSVGICTGIGSPRALRSQPSPSRVSRAITRPVSGTPRVRVTRASSVPPSSTIRQ